VAWEKSVLDKMKIVWNDRWLNQRAWPAYDSRGEKNGMYGVRGKKHFLHGHKWYNNGYKEVFKSPKDIPEGFVYGRLPKSEESIRKQTEKIMVDNNPAKRIEIRKSISKGLLNNPPHPRKRIYAEGKIYEWSGDVMKEYGWKSRTSVRNRVWSDKYPDWYYV